MKLFLVLIIFVISLTGYSQSNSNKEFPLIDSIGFETNYNKFELNSTYWKEVGLDSLESYNNSFKYYLISKSEQERFDIIIIARKHIEEDIHWTCIINKKGELVDWCMTAYDNSGGFLSIKSQFEGLTFLVTEWNIYSKPNETKRKYTVTESGLIE